LRREKFGFQDRCNKPLYHPSRGKRRR
jgi:hypothetical protein